jgi:hypothetical protein
LEAKWLASLRQFLQSVGGTIELGENNIVPLQREHDQLLMDYVLSSGKFKPAQIRRLNYCRMYLNVLLLSDITNASGDMIERSMYSGDKPSKELTKHPVNQPKPDKKARRQWNRLLQILNETHYSKRLKQPLGNLAATMARSTRQMGILV